MFCEPMLPFPVAAPNSPFSLDDVVVLGVVCKVGSTKTDDVLLLVYHIISEMIVQMVCTKALNRLPVSKWTNTVELVKSSGAVPSVFVDAQQALIRFLDDPHFFKSAKKFTRPFLALSFKRAVSPAVPATPVTTMRLFKMTAKLACKWIYMCTALCCPDFFLFVVCSLCFCLYAICILVY
jgi:hypothetical protein